MSETPVVPRPAATALLVRSHRSGSGLQVFMVQRHRRSGFLPHAWVFPGGRVDDTDRLMGHPRVRGRLVLAGLSESGALAYGVAAVRETYEEAGLWLGTGQVAAEHREAVANGDLPLTELLERADANVDLAKLRPWSWWITPAAEPKRFDTRFLIALAPEGEGSHDTRETVDCRWVDPREVIRSGLEKFPMAPPTWWTLRELATCDSAEAAFALAEMGPPLPILPTMIFEEQGFRLLLPGHPDHGAPAIEGLPDQITFERSEGEGRWVAWRGEQRI
jgi:8-oxo-dGTP pyrophosphatase MutT (NUDIX family)